MYKVSIQGGRRLKGAIQISGAKNAALPLMAASLLTESDIKLSNIPEVVDIATMQSLLTIHGASFELMNEKTSKKRTLLIRAKKIVNTVAPYDLVRKMRASILVLGPLLTRCGHAKVSLPGGCAIGARPVDIHLNALKSLGAEIEVEEGYIHAVAKDGLKGAKINFPSVSVGATENALLAATLARGETVLHNAASEPEIVDLINCLKKMGAKIEGGGTRTLHIQGVDCLCGAEHKIIPDRIEAGTYAIAVGIAGGEVELLDARKDLLEEVLSVLCLAGLEINETEKGLRVICKKNRIKSVDVSTGVFPAFPTDLQAQIMSLMCISRGKSLITEKIFEGRFMHVPELCRMGAKIRISGQNAYVTGAEKLYGASVMATDLRASVALVLAGLGAEGKTEVNRVYHLDRGYENLEKKLKNCGAAIERVLVH